MLTAARSMYDGGVHVHNRLLSGLVEQGNAPAALLKVGEALVTALEKLRLLFRNE
ncbi:hypothetical protein [Paraburkholderia sediminicola]|uniref:hypothetical protein n=1 Tax=Paraburkholderia sediminicola TaxID=458836 RepID=UPI0038BB49BE